MMKFSPKKISFAPYCDVFTGRFVESMGKATANKITESLLSQVGSLISHVVTSNLTSAFQIKSYGQYHRLELMTAYKWISERIIEQGNPITRIVAMDEAQASVVIPGSYLFTYEGALFYARITEAEKQLNEETSVNVTLTLTTLRTNRALLNQIKREVSPAAAMPDATMQVVMEAAPKNFTTLSRPVFVKKKVLSDVIVPDEVRRQIMQRIELWQDREDWYFENNFAHKVSFEFSGPPGTGKTSLAQAIAGQLDIPLVIYRVEDITRGDFGHIMRNELPARCVVLFDDFDIAEVFQDRDVKDTQIIDVGSNPHASSSARGGVRRLLSNGDAGDGETTLASILRTLSGPIPLNGKILVFTTNKHHTIDQAVLRKGRIDCHLQINALEDAEIKTFIHRHYGDVDLSEYSFFPTSGSVLTDILYQNPDDVQGFLKTLTSTK